MRGKKYPTDPKEINAEIGRIDSELGRIEKELFMKVKKEELMRAAILGKGVGVVMTTFSEMMNLVVMYGERAGISNSKMGECVQAGVMISPFNSDLDYFLSMMGLEAHKNGRGVPNNRLYLEHYLSHLSDAASHRGIPDNELGSREREILDMVRDALEDWRENVTDVILTTVPQEERPGKPQLKRGLKKPYSDCIYTNFVDFRKLMGAEGRNVIARSARIEEGDIVADVGTGSGFMLPILQNYGPGRLMAIDIRDYPEKVALINQMNLGKGRTDNVVCDYFDFGEEVDVSVCSEAFMFDGRLLDRMASMSRKGIVLGTLIPSYMSTYEEVMENNTGRISGTKRCYGANFRLKELERKAHQHFTDVDVTGYRGIFILRAHGKK
jgi:hypothetical protein